MIQDIYPHQFNNEYTPNKSVGENDFIIHFNEDKLLLKLSGHKFELPRWSDIQKFSADANFEFLFKLNEIPCYLILSDLNLKGSQLVYEDLSFFRTTQQKEIAWASMVGYHLMNWYSQNKFCGKCGAKTLPKEKERALVCSECEFVFYPKIAPAIIVAILCRNKILLIRGSNFPGSWYSLVAGYTDIGESLEETVKREVKEEVGLDVSNIRYYKSQPWPLSGSMMIGFIAEADDSQPIIIDYNELVAAEWFERGNLPEHSSNISIAGEMIEKFEQGVL